MHSLNMAGRHRHHHHHERVIDDGHFYPHSLPLIVCILFFTKVFFEHAFFEDPFKDRKRERERVFRRL